MANKKNTIIKLFKERIEEINLKNWNNLDVYTLCRHEFLGEEKIVYHGKDIFGNKIKVKHISPDIQTLRNIIIKSNKKSEPTIMLMVEIDHKYDDGEYNEVVKVPIFWGLLHTNKTKYYTYRTINTTASYKIRFGAVIEKITENEYKELVKIAVNKHSAIIEESRIYMEKKFEKAKKRDLKKLKEKEIIKKKK